MSVACKLSVGLINLAHVDYQNYWNKDNNFSAYRNVRVSYLVCVSPVSDNLKFPVDFPRTYREPANN